MTEHNDPSPSERTREPDRIDHALREKLAHALAQEPERPSDGIQLGSFVIRRLIGGGAFGYVFLAENAQGGQVAIKTFRWKKFDEANERLDAAARFWGGAMHMLALDSPHIVRVVSGPQISPEGFIWFAMEYVEGGDLNAALRKKELTWRQREKVANDLIAAIEVAHAKGIVHRDIRPQNILLRRDADGYSAVLTDFDIAYYEHFLQARDSTAVSVGVHRYLPPEVFKGGSVAHLKELLRRPSNDFYSLCVVLFDMFVGSEHPVNADIKTLKQLIAANELESEPSKAPRALRSRVAHTCATGLQQDAEHRFRTLKALKSRLGFAAITPRVAEAVALGVAASWLLCACILLDAIVPPSSTTPSRESFFQVGVIFGPGLPTLAIVQRLLTPPQEPIPPWRRWIAEFVSRYRRFFFPALIVSIAGSAILFSQLSVYAKRARYVLRGATSCRYSPADARSPLELHDYSEFVLGPELNPMIACVNAGVATVVPLTAFFPWPRPEIKSLVEETNRQPSGANQHLGSARPPDPKSCPPNFGLLAGATFRMGADDSRTTRHVTVPPFCIGKTEISVREYLACVLDGACDPVSYLNEWPGIPSYMRKQLDPVCAVAGTNRELPINCVSWASATKYCKSRGWRLPSEAEWEFATGRPSGAIYPWRNREPTSREEPNGTVVNACGQECARSRQRGPSLADRNPLDGGLEAGTRAALFRDEWPNLAPVDALKKGATSAGVVNLLGNVAEWTDDVENNDQGMDKPVRGGSWYEFLGDAHSSVSVERVDASSRSARIGFRCAASL